MSELEAAKNKLKVIFKIALLEQNISQIELAKMLNTSQSQISRALSGGTTPKDIAIQKAVAKILQIEI